ncbi:acyl-CoA dehydrogenase family protein [Rhodopirellula baltica]
MSKRDALYDELFDDDGARLSDDAETNVDNGRRLLGATLVGVMDRSIETALDTVSGTNTFRDGSPLYAERQELCDTFASMTDAQRDAVRALVRDNASLMLFSICSKLDQFPGFDVAIHLRTLPTDAPEMQDFAIASGDHDELHGSYHQWLDDYSDQVTEGG